MRATTTIAVLLAATTAAAQDSLQLKDGRFVIDHRMSRDEKGVTIHYTNGDVFIPHDRIRSSTALDKAGKAGPMSAEDRAKADKGLVLHEGRWIKKELRDQELEKLRAKRKQAIEEAKTRRLWKNRHIKKTQNFQFEFTLDPELMQSYIDLMETYYKVFTKEWRITKPAGQKRLPVCFYHNEDYFHQVGGVPEGVLGYFRFVQPIDLNFFYDRLDPELTQDVMFHEANHYLTYLIDPKFHYPSWVNESLAEYYGASEWDPKSKRMVVGGIQEGRLAVIQDAVGANQVGKGTSNSTDKGKWLGLEEMIRIPRFQAIHYAWGWSFVHFLLSNKQYAGKFKRFYIDLARSPRVKKVLARGGYNMRTVEPDEQIRVLKQYLGVKDLKALQQEWYRYILSLKAASARGYHRAGQFALSRNMPIKAQRLFQISIDMGSKNPTTWAYLAKAQLQKRKYEEATKSVDKAIEMDPLNGMFYILKGRCISAGHKPDDKAKRLRQLALEVDPDNDQVILEVAWDHLGEDDDK